MTNHHTQGKTVAKDIADTAKARATSAADHVADAVADTAERKAASLREAGAAFADTPYARQAAEQLSDGLSQMAASLRDADLGALPRDVADFARRNPLLFFGGAIALGFVAGRALKASDRAERTEEPVALPGPTARPDLAHGAPRQWGHS